MCVMLIMTTTAQKRFSEGTVVYSIQITNTEKHIQSSSECTQLIKGAHYRDDLISSIGKSTTIFDMREGTGAILKEYGGQKIMIPIVSEQWEQKIKRVSSISFKNTPDKKNILGYTCEKAEAVLEDGSTVYVFFTKDLVSENQDMDLQFPQLGGFALEFTSVKQGTTIVYTASSLNFDPVPIQRFDIPNAGYRILSFEESRKMNRN